MGWQCRSNYRKHEALTSIPITATEEREEGRKEGWKEDGQFLLPILTSHCLILFVQVTYHFIVFNYTQT
jgi:hypothetical protein